MTVVQVMYEHLQLNLKIIWIIFFEAATVKLRDLRETFCRLAIV